MLWTAIVHMSVAQKVRITYKMSNHDATGNLS